jgi:hypothetical protein
MFVADFFFFYALFKLVRVILELSHADYAVLCAEPWGGSIHWEYFSYEDLGKGVLILGSLTEYIQFFSFVTFMELVIIVAKLRDVNVS